jgi:hypothetical protein
LWSAPQNPKSWISKALCAFEIQLLEKIEGFSDLLIWPGAKCAGGQNLD